jgi:hypothetical protein
MKVKRAIAYRGRRKKGEKTKPEKLFEQELLYRLRSGQITWYAYECFKLKVGEFKDWYTPDFMAVDSAGCINFFEVKGGLIREDAREKFKSAAKQYPMFKWIMLQYKDREGWKKIYET